MTNNAGKVAVTFTEENEYPSKVPFYPPENFPEYAGNAVDPNNYIYSMVRDTLYRLGMDKENFNTEKWNPFKEIIKPGMTVFIKPNTVTHEHEEGKDIFSVIVHASIVRPILDYVCKALNNRGRIILGDSQLYYCNFPKAMKVSLIEDLLSWYKDKTDVEFQCFDLRMNVAYRTYLYGRWGRKKVEQDPQGYQFVDLGNSSRFTDIDPKKLRIAIASYKNMIKHHSGGKHEYLFPQSFLDSDAVISIPKLKTHRRTAVTLALKNFMGIPAWKDTLPHFMVGSPAEGGDQYINKSLRKSIVTRLHDIKESNPFMPVKFLCAIAKNLLWNSHKIIPFKDDIYEAMWYGNDTLWRTLADLNRAVIYADRQGKLCDKPQRNVFFLIDGIIGGEKNGPLLTDPVNSGVLLAGYNAVAIDAVGATLMGYDIEKIPLIAKTFEDENERDPIFKGLPGDIEVIDDGSKFSLEQLKKVRNLNFEPHPGWKGHIELEKPVS